MGEQFSLLSDILIRVDCKERIRKQYSEGFLEFGCPANWIQFADTHADGIADKFEAICGHVERTDERLSMICDDGVPLNAFRSLWNEELDDGTVFVRYIYHCLTPTICFFSSRFLEPLKENNQPIQIDLSLFYKSLGLNQDECALLIVRNPNMLFSELRDEIPNALASNGHINLEKYNDNCRLLTELVKYDLNLDVLFFSNIRSLKCLYQKLPKYQNQREARLIIPDVYFTADPVYNRNAYKDNRLVVNLPNLKKYCDVIDAKKADVIIASDYRTDTKDFNICIKKRD